MKSKATIISNIEFWFKAQGLRISDYVILTLADRYRAFGWPVGGKLRKLTEKWDQDPFDIEEYLHGEGAQSFREPGGVFPAMQVNYFAGDPATGVEFVEIDFDYASPLADPISFLIHAGEFLWNWLGGNTTNQETVRKLLEWRFRRAPALAAASKPSSSETASSS